MPRFPTQRKPNQSTTEICVLFHPLFSQTHTVHLTPTMKESKHYENVPDDEVWEVSSGDVHLTPSPATDPHAGDDTTPPTSHCSAPSRCIDRNKLCLTFWATLIFVVGTPFAVSKWPARPYSNEDDIIYNAHIILAEYLQKRDEIISEIPAGYHTLPLCVHNHEMFPGQVSANLSHPEHAEWIPTAPCRVQHYSAEQARDCLKRSGTRISFYGDSLMAGLGMGIAYKLNLSRTIYGQESSSDQWPVRNNFDIFLPEDPKPSLQFFWTISTHLLDPTNPARHNASIGLNADFVLVHQMLWELGPACLGIFNYYKTMITRLRRMRRAMSPSAQMVLFSGHHLYPGKCIQRYGDTARCYTKNTEDRLGAATEAMHLAARCTNTLLYSNMGIYEALPSYTEDGLHFEDPLVWALEGDIFLNGLCPRSGAGPMHFINATEQSGLGCNEAEMFAKWKLQPRALYCQ